MIATLLCLFAIGAVVGATINLVCQVFRVPDWLTGVLITGGVALTTLSLAIDVRDELAHRNRTVLIVGCQR